MKPRKDTEKDPGEAILEYWFEGLSEENALKQSSRVARRWFGKDEATDREIRERFEKDYLRAARGEFGDWEQSPRGRLALVILTDQFPRNMYRDSARAFESDPLALEVSLRAIRDGQDQFLALMERMFLYMPLMHSESGEVQKQAVRLFEGLARLSKEENSPFARYLAMSSDYGRRHAEIIERFGRFPHRNQALERESTPEEIAFLKEPGSSF